MGPKTIGFIMDGNRRWAKEQGLPSFEGHRAGLEKLKKVLRWSKDAGVENIIVWALSTENLKRTQEEVSYLFDLIKHAAKEFFEELHKEGVRIKCVGDLSLLPKDVREILQNLEEKTKNNQKYNFYIALAYGGRNELLHVMKAVAEEKLPPEEVTEEYVAKHLLTAPMPDPDLIIRTSGEMRLSGFLPWQSVYSELFFTKTYWPAFSKEEFDSILGDFSKRERRMGK